MLVRSVYVYKKERSREHTGNLIQSGGKTEIGLAPYAASFTLYYTNRVGLRAGSDSGRVVYRPLPASIAVKRVEDPPLRHRPQGPSPSHPSYRLDARERERENEMIHFSRIDLAHIASGHLISRIIFGFACCSTRTIRRIRKFASRRDHEAKHGRSPLEISGEKARGREREREREPGRAETPPRGRVFAAAYSDSRARRGLGESHSSVFHGRE